MTQAARTILKTMLPDPVRTLLRRSIHYAGRLRQWAAIARVLRGAGRRDRAILRRALLAAPITSLSGLDRWHHPTTDEDVVVDVAAVGRFRLRANSDDLYHVLPHREPAVLEAIKRLLRPGDVFLDAGANVGFYTVLASRIVGSAGHVVAIEMMPDTAALLRQHVRMNGLHNVTVVERALSDVGGEIATATVAEGEFGQASVSTDIASPGRRAVEVETTTLAAVIADLGNVRLMKMDVEGVEERALRGAGEGVARIEHVIFEKWSDAASAGVVLEKTHEVRRLDGRNSLASRAPGADTAP
ncbi:FkbM family methyltransferase [Hansschlegelia plantiphila]|uniref:Methyltransferase FkbM domain-containing protein n=1 Tax=Hansschlegelia plantiphila TaxID=374655 RepID=A0A9W6J2L3_9HYPH|nr:FkbM family methyltransferase [Hansschlegelia plantiphila]GLK69705.1 hypothetical protein GCM10008179_33430 [Hansschlegelia plantiphila]